MKKIISAILVLVLTVSCAHSYEKDWSAFKATPKYAAEKDTFIKNLDGKSPCLSKSLGDFLYNNATPDPNCIYISSPMKVIQVQSDGYLTSASQAKSNLFIRKTDERGLVDGAIVNRSDLNFYEYSGVMTYNSVLGTRTVHTFKKVTAKVMQAQNDLKYYSPIEELYAERGLWKQSDQHMKRQKGDYTDYGKTAERIGYGALFVGAWYFFLQAVGVL